MPKISVPKKTLEKLPNLPPGMYQVRCDGFKPDWSQGKDGKQKSINLRPQMKVVNNPNAELNGRPVLDWVNVNAGWILQDFLHCFGQEFVENGDDVDIPGEFLYGGSDPNLPTGYQGPLLGQIGDVELIQSSDGKYTNVKRYICKVPGCQVQHSENLQSK